jgi:hypothetical protein
MPKIKKEKIAETLRELLLEQELINKRIDAMKKTRAFIKKVR